MSNHNDWTRRDTLKAGLSMLLAEPVTAAASAEGGTVAVGLVLRETAGLRRFGFPVHALLPGDLLGRNARLLREGRPVDAQFRRVVGADGRPALALDFVSGVGPLETERYVVEVGDGVEPGPEPKRAVRVERESEAFRVTAGAADAYGRRPTRWARYRALRTRGCHTSCRTRAGSLSATRTTRRIVGAPAPGARPAGPALTPPQRPARGRSPGLLHFEGSVDLPGARPSATSADLTFPSSKSWVETAWRAGVTRSGSSPECASSFN